MSVAKPIGPGQRRLLIDCRYGSAGNRSTYILTNLGNTQQVGMLWYGDETVTEANGTPLAPNDQVSVDFLVAGRVYGYSPTTTIDTRVFGPSGEVAT